MELNFFQTLYCDGSGLYLFEMSIQSRVLTFDILAVMGNIPSTSAKVVQTIAKRSAVSRPLHSSIQANCVFIFNSETVKSEYLYNKN